MLTRDSVCPVCASRWSDIRGVIFPSGSLCGNSFSCVNGWHNGPVTLSGEFDWTEDDVELLRQMGILAETKCHS